MEVGTDRRAGHTKPGDDKLTMHPKMHENQDTTAIYLGFHGSWQLNRCIFLPVVIQITRLLYPLLADPHEREHLDKIFAWFVESGSDARFRAKYARSASELMAALYGKASGESPADRKATATACLLVWAYSLLSRIQDPSSPTSRGSGVLETEGPQYDSLVEDVYASIGSVAKRTRAVVGSKRKRRESAEETLEEAYGPISHIMPLDKWEGEVHPKIRHFVQYDEHEFEKYCRIIVLVRLCARTILDMATMSRALEARASYRREDDILYPDGETGFDKEKHRHFRSYVSGPRAQPPIDWEDMPFWMRKLRTWIKYLLVPSTHRVHSTEDLLRAEANPIEPVTGENWQNLIVGGGLAPVESITADVGQLNWADVLCWQHGFLRPGRRRQLASLALFHGSFEEYSREALAKEGEWTPLFADPNDPSIGVPFTFDDLVELLTDKGNPTTLVVGHYPPHLPGPVFPFHGQHYLEMQDQGRSNRPRSEFAVASHDDGDDDEE